MGLIVETCVWLVTAVSLLALCPDQCAGQGAGRQGEEAGAASPEECGLTFTLPPNALSGLCRPQEVTNLIESLQSQHDEASKANQQLQKDLDSIRKEYASMVETVKRLERETSSWREIVEWPAFDEKFKPDNMSMVTDDSQTYLDCYDAFARGKNKQGIYTLKPIGAQHSFFAYCDGEGWTIILRRFDGSTDFYRGWSDYSGGFGELSGEFWIGLEQIHMLTRDEDHEIFVEALGWNNKLYTARHPGFSVGEELSGYELSVGNMTEGDYADAFGELDGLRFTARDRDYDLWGGNNCADYYNGGWWLQNCGWDPNRRWCNGRGCMTFGEVNAKKISMKIKTGDPSAAAKRPKMAKKKPKKAGKKPKNKPKQVRKPKSRPAGK